MLSTLFSVVFTIFASILMTFTFENGLSLKVASGSLYVAQTVILLVTNFDATDLSYHTLISVFIAVVYTIVLVPVFFFLTDAILKETLDEQKLSY